MFPDFISGDTLSQCATFFFLLLLRPGRHYRSVPRHPLKRVHTIAVCPPPFFFFFSPAALVGPFFLRPGRHHRGVPWHFLTREALSQCFSCEQEIPHRCGNEVDGGLRILKGPGQVHRESPLCNATELTREGRTLCPGIYRSSALHYKTCTVMCSRYAAFQACQCAGIANVKNEAAKKLKG